MSTVAVIVDLREGAVAGPSLELLTLARSLGSVRAVVLGTPAADAVATLGAYGAQSVATVSAAAAVPSQAASAIEAALGDASVVLFTSTFAGKEVAARLAVSLRAGVSVDVQGVELVDGAVETTQNVFAATWNVRSRITTPIAIVGVRPNSVTAVAADAPASAAVEEIDWQAHAALETVVSRTPVEREAGIPLAEAPVVVAGGRGTRGDYTLVRELAELLGGAVGASRDATDEGWISHEHMVGQTGTTVTPALYVACGISGAVHHRGGMQASGTIVAVNIDPDAPIFEIADFGVVGDLGDVLPQAIAAIKAARG